MIAVRNFKVSASQIEEVAYNHEAIKEAVAVGVPDVEFGEVPMLFFVLNEGYTDQVTKMTEDIKRLYQEKLKGLAVPKYYRCLDRIPYTANNKQDFRKLEEVGKEFVESMKDQPVIKKELP